MAEELTLTALFKYVKGNNTVQPTGKVATAIDVTGTNVLSHVQNIGTTQEAITLGDVTPGGYCYIENLDTTNFVSIRQATGASDMIRVKAGEMALFRLDADATGPFAIADTAACDVLFVLLEN